MSCNRFAVATDPRIKSKKRPEPSGPGPRPSLPSYVANIITPSLQSLAPFEPTMGPRTSRIRTAAGSGPAPQHPPEPVFGWIKSVLRDRPPDRFAPSTAEFISKVSDRVRGQIARQLGRELLPSRRRALPSGRQEAGDVAFRGGRDLGPRRVECGLQLAGDTDCMHTVKTKGQVQVSRQPRCPRTLTRNMLMQVLGAFEARIRRGDGSNELKIG